MPRDHESLVRQIEQRAVSDPRIVAALRRVDRADFVPEQLKREAYLDRPVAIPDRQTTSQPSLIAQMIEAASISPGDRVLEIGTGYGYQTALLAAVAGAVVSIERFPALAEAARANLGAAGIEGVEVIVGNGWEGAAERAPFDAIVVSAAAPEVPPDLADQLAEGGRLVIPVASGSTDNVWLFVKRGGSLEKVRLVTPARFVPFVKRGPE